MEAALTVASFDRESVAGGRRTGFVFALHRRHRHAAFYHCRTDYCEDDRRARFYPMILTSSHRHPLSSAAE